MVINDRSLDQAFSELKGTCGGVRNDYFGVLYLEQEFNLERSHAVSQVAFGSRDYGIDGFHFDREKRNLYLFQFKWSETHALFKESFERLIESGMERVFAARHQDQHQNQLLHQLKSCLVENESVVDRVCIHFVFLGDPSEAERSQVLDKLREDLENKKYLIDQRFERQVTLVIEFRSARTRKVGPASHQRKTHAYPVHLDDVISRKGPRGETMTIGFVALRELYGMYREMGERFFERNIRGALGDGEVVNRSLKQALKRIVLDRKDEPEVFAFSHNGVTLSAEAISDEGGSFRVTEPRLLNGAQTLTTFAGFLRANEDNRALRAGEEVLDGISVMCRIISDAEPEFVTAVTVNNNRQNPVEPWNLRANDMIQLQIQDWFREELGIYYERQENAFGSLSDEELEERGIAAHKAIELPLLARTFLASDGELDRMSRFREVFEDERAYGEVFNEKALPAFPWVGT